MSNSSFAKNSAGNVYEMGSRWYALGIICLTRSTFCKQWDDAFPGSSNSEVYSASIARIWTSWNMPEELKNKVNSFMKENFMEIQKSFSNWDNLDTFKIWFRRYANRLVGANPPWEIQNGGTADDLETFLRGERVLSNVLVAPLISRLFMESGEAVLKVVAPSRIP